MYSQINDACLIPFPAGTPTLPSGWLNGYDAAVLYTVARKQKNEASILEVGSWVGRSSVAICYGIRDAAPLKIRYDIVDYGIAGVDEWRSRFGGNLFAHKEAKRLAEVVMFPGGTGALLKQNLVDRLLSGFVSLIVLGDFRDYETSRKYDFAFCDATHGESEIKKNIPLLRRFLKDEFVLICDDIISKEDAILTHELIGSERYYLTSASKEYSKMGIFTRGAFNAMFS